MFIFFAGLFRTKILSISLISQIFNSRPRSVLKEDRLWKKTCPSTEHRDKDGSFASTSDVKKVKTRCFALPSNWDELLDKEIEESGMIQAEYLEKLVINKLKRSKYRKK